MSCTSVSLGLDDAEDTHKQTDTQMCARQSLFLSYSDQPKGLLTAMESRAPVSPLTNSVCPVRA